MNPKIILLLVVVCAIIAETSSSCACGASGHDTCSCTRKIIRPQPMPRIETLPRKVCKWIGGGTNYSPIGDICSCGNHMVKPAILPKPSCSQSNLNDDYEEQPRLPIGKKLSNIQYETYNQGLPINEEIIYATTSKPNILQFPADIVSLDLAYKQAQQASVSIPEEKLQYGPRGIPKDQPNRRVLGNIPEERLMSVDRAIYQLKETKKRTEEVSNESEESEEDSENDQIPSYLAYQDVGYYNEIPKNTQFIIQKQEERQITGCSDLLPVPEIGDCGYKPGSVIDGDDRKSNTRQYYEMDDVHDYEDIQPRARKIFDLPKYQGPFYGLLHKAKNY